MIIDYIILQCIKKLKGERTTASIYHILAGKRSAQTLQDANIYYLTSFFSVFKSLPRKRFEQQINELHKNNYITLDAKDNAHLTVNGNVFLQKEHFKQLVSTLKGMEYARISDVLWLRVQLWIQTYTNIANENSNFVVITDNEEVQAWVKHHYSKYNKKAEEWLTGVHRELNAFLKQIDPFLAMLFVERLSGYKKIGLTKNQLAKKHQVAELDIHIYQIIVIHKLIDYIEGNEEKLKYLTTFYSDINSFHTFMTDSAMKTYKFFKKGFDINQIATIRNLKVSTIQDHIIEIAFADANFAITRFVNQYAIDTIALVVNELDTTKLKKIRHALNDQYSYFEIRLVLAYLKAIT